MHVNSLHTTYSRRNTQLHHTPIHTHNKEETNTHTSLQHTHTHTPSPLIEDEHFIYLAQHTSFQNQNLHICSSYHSTSHFSFLSGSAGQPTCTSSSRSTVLIIYTLPVTQMSCCSLNLEHTLASSGCVCVFSMHLPLQTAAPPRSDEVRGSLITLLYSSTSPPIQQ